MAQTNIFNPGSMFNPGGASGGGGSSLTGKSPEDQQRAGIVSEYEVTPKTLANALENVALSGVSAMVWGPPGIGKTDVTEQVGQRLAKIIEDRPFRYYPIEAHLQPLEDLTGIPRYDEFTGTTRKAPPYIFPPSDSEDFWYICIEELTSCPTMVQAALYSLVLKGELGEYRLPQHHAIVACGNRESDRGVSHRMPTPLASRFVHYTLLVDVPEWLAWAASQLLAPEIIFFIEFRPELLHQFDPKSKSPAFPCPRTWHKLSKIMRHRRNLNDIAEQATFRGLVGNGAGVEFCAFLQVWRELTPPRMIINNPTTIPIPQKPDALMATCGSLYEIATNENFDAIFQYAKRLRPELGEFLMSRCIDKDDTLKFTNAYAEWVALNFS